MANETIVTYIRSQLAAGVQKDAIRAALAQQGWQVADIDSGFAAVEQPASGTSPLPAPVTITPTTPAATESSGTSIHTNWLLWGGVILVGVAITLGGIYGWQFIQKSFLASAPEPEVTEEPVVPAEEERVMEPLTESYTFMPEVSSIPAFVMGYPSSAGAPAESESAAGLVLTFGAAQATLTFSIFPSPLEDAQTMQQYFAENFPTATVTFGMAGAHTLAALKLPDFAADQTVYYIFVDDNALTIDARGAVDPRIIESIKLGILQ